MKHRAVLTLALLPILSFGTTGNSADSTVRDRDASGVCWAAPVGWPLWVHEFEESEELSAAQASSVDGVEAAASVDEGSIVLISRVARGFSLSPEQSMFDDEHPEAYEGEVEGDWQNEGPRLCHTIPPFGGLYLPHCSEHGVTLGGCGSHYEPYTEETPLESKLVAKLTARYVRP